VNATFTGIFFCPRHHDLFGIRANGITHRIDISITSEREAGADGKTM
jgi:hypothetical protein